MANLAGIFEEIRRRRVVRALVGWGVAAFAILQVTEPIMHALGLEDWVLEVVVGVLAAGFPVTAMLSWAFDLTAAGVRRTPAAPLGDGGPTPRLGRWRTALVVAAVSTAAAAPGVGWLLLRGRPEQEAPAGTRIAVAVADVENATGEPDLDALSGLLITSLEQSRRLEVMTRSRMFDLLRQLGHVGGARIDEPLGRELSRQAGVRALVLAAIRRFDSLYTIELKVLDPVTSTYLFTLKQEGKGKASVPAMIDRLSERTRQRLKERPADVAASRVEVAQAVTPDLEAYRHYFAGRALADGRSDYAPAMKELEEAVRLDPAFAMAWYEIAYLGEWVDMPEVERRAALERALQRVALVGEKERSLMLAWKAHQDGRDLEATAIYERAVETFPGDAAIQFFAGDLPFHASASPRGSTVDLRRVLPRFQAAAALEPTDGEKQWHLVATLQRLGKLQEAEAAARAWVAVAPTPRAVGTLGQVLAQLGRDEEALDALRRSMEQGRHTAIASSQAWLLAVLGRQGEAEAALEQTPATGPLERLATGVARAALLLRQGRYTAALERLEGLPSRLVLEARRDVPARARAGILAARGDVGGAWRVARELLDAGAGLDLVPLQLALAGDLRHGALAAEGLLPGSPQRELHDAVAAWKAGRTDEGARRLGELQQSPIVVVRTLADMVQGELEAGRGRFEAARPLLERALSASRMVGGDLALVLRRPRAQLLLARSYLKTGEPRRAASEVESLLATWGPADAELALLREARSLRGECSGALARGTSRTAATP